MGHGIMALFGAPLALEDHATRGCHAGLRMQETVREYAKRVFTPWRYAQTGERDGVCAELTVAAAASEEWVCLA